MEFNRDLVAGLVEHSAGDLDVHAGRPFVQTRAEITAASYATPNELLYRLLDRLAAR
jgi:hypothetical protein